MGASGNDSVRVSVEGAIRDFKEIKTRTLDEIDKALNKIGNQIATTAKRSMKGRNSESIEGAPPRVGTGLTRGSITSAVKSDLFRSTLYVGTSVWYARPLETKENVPGRPAYRGKIHPFLKPALDAKTEAQYMEEIKASVAKAVKK
jgi:hypothetical protein